MKAIHLTAHQGLLSPLSWHLPQGLLDRDFALDLRSGLTTLLNAAAGSSYAEPRIWQRHDRQGHLWFEVYEPHSHQRLCFSSEQEVRNWLDRRFYA